MTEKSDFLTFFLTADLEVSVTVTGFFFVTFLSEQPSNESIALLQEMKFDKEEYQLIEKALYLYCPNGYGKTKLNNNFLERKLGVSATTRNWKTVMKLFSISN